MLTNFNIANVAYGVGNIAVIDTGGNINTSMLSLSNTTSSTSISLLPGNPLSNFSLKLPSSSGTSGQVLQTDGTGNMYWGVNFGGPLPGEVIATTPIDLGTVRINLQEGNIFDIALTDDITDWDFTNIPPSGTALNFMIKIVGQGTIRNILWPTIEGYTLVWPNGIPPTTLTTGTSLYTFYIDNSLFIGYTLLQGEV